MRRRGWEVTLLTGSLEQDPAPGYTVIDDVDVVRYRIPRPRLGTGRDPHAEAAAMCSAIGRRLSERWDVVHGHAPVSALAIEEFLSPDRVGRRVYTAHSPASRELAVNAMADGLIQRVRSRAGGWVLRRLEERALRRADAIHVLSRYSAQLVEEIHGPAASRKVTEIPWFVESDAESVLDRADARRRLGWTADEFHVITVRRLVPRMGVETLVLANALLPHDSRIFVHVIGDGPQRASLERLASSGHRSGSLTFHGRLSEPDAEAAYAAADAFILPTLALEGFGLVILEALGRGVPVIGSNIGAIPEVLGQIDPAAVVEPGDAVALAHKILALASKGVTAERRAFLAQRVRELFPQKETLDKYEAFFAGGATTSTR
jgi:glycosyltransferase involved in cell wall biosynthesis